MSTQPTPSIVQQIHSRQQQRSTTRLSQLLQAMRSPSQRARARNRMQRLSATAIRELIRRHHAVIATGQGFLRILAGRLTRRHRFEKILWDRWMTHRGRDRWLDCTMGDHWAEFDRQFQRSVQGLPNGIDGLFGPDWLYEKDPPDDILQIDITGRFATWKMQQRMGFDRPDYFDQFRPVTLPGVRQNPKPGFVTP